MGAYIYGAKKVGAVTTTTGEVIYPATYRFKPFHNWDSERLNKRLMFSTGCYATERAFKGQTVLAAPVTGFSFDSKPEAVYSVFRAHEGLFNDEAPRSLVGRLTRAEGAWVYTPYPEDQPR